MAAVKKLVEVHKVALDITDQGETPLIAAVRGGSTDVVRVLLKHKPRLDVKYKGLTGIEWAKKNPQLYQIFQMEGIQLMTIGDIPRLLELVDAGLDTSDDSDFSLLKWARSMGVKEVEDILCNKRTTGTSATRSSRVLVVQFVGEPVSF